MAAQVDPLATEADALSPQTPPLELGPEAGAERDAPAGAHDPVPGHSPGPLGVESAQGPADGPGSPGHAEQASDLAVGGDAAARDPPHGLVDASDGASVCG